MPPPARPMQPFPTGLGPSACMALKSPSWTHLGPHSLARTPGSVPGPARQPSCGPPAVHSAGSSRAVQCPGSVGIEATAANPGLWFVEGRDGQRARPSVPGGHGAVQEAEGRAATGQTGHVPPAHLCCQGATVAWERRPEALSTGTRAVGWAQAQARSERRPASAGVQEASAGVQEAAPGRDLGGSQGTGATGGLSVCRSRLTSTLHAACVDHGAWDREEGGRAGRQEAAGLPRRGSLVGRTKEVAGTGSCARVLGSIHPFHRSHLAVHPRSCHLILLPEWDAPSTTHQGTL